MEITRIQSMEVSISDFFKVVQELYQIPFFGIFKCFGDFVQYIMNIPIDLYLTARRIELVKLRRSKQFIEQISNTLPDHHRRSQLGHEA